jgi:hypothetical protein
MHKFALDQGAAGDYLLGQEAIMAETKSIPGISQAQQTADGFKKLIDDQINRFGSMTEEMAKLEAKGLEQARSAVDEAAKLAKESLAYAGQLGAEWRKLAIEATRRAAEMMQFKA